MLQSHYNTVVAENEMLRRELHGSRMEGAPASHPQQQPPSQGPPAAAPAVPQQAPYPSDHYASSSRPELPPLRSISGGLPNGPESMTGVQYEAPRVNGYQAERRY